MTHPKREYTPEEMIEAAARLHRSWATVMKICDREDAAKACADMLESLASQLAAQKREWSPIETAPRDSRKVLVAWKTDRMDSGWEVREAWWRLPYEGAFSKECYWCTGENGMLLDASIHGLGASHWMPLPQPPSPDQELEAEPVAWAVLQNSGNLLCCENESSARLTAKTYGYTLVPLYTHSQQRNAVENDLVQRLRGRAAYLRNLGRIKSPQLMESAATALSAIALRDREDAESYQTDKVNIEKASKLIADTFGTPITLSINELAKAILETCNG
jgi:hypothetical protein